jgi:phage replication O-like protein O
MSEKLKPNFTPVPNVILDEIMRKLTPSAVKVLLAICRYTYGWGKQSDRISSNQLAEMTGMDRSNVRRSLKQLGALVIIRPGDPKRNQASEYRLNIDVSDSDLVSIRQQDLVSLRHQPGVRPGVKTPPIQRKPKKEDSTEPNGSITLPHSKKRKHAAPDPATLAAFERFYQAYPRHVAKAEAQKAWLKLTPAAEIIPVIMAAVARYADSVQDDDPKFIKYPGLWLNGKRWEDEPVASNGNGHAKPTEVKDLGNGMIEVDGVRMDRRIYERRYGQHAN